MRRGLAALLLIATVTLLGTPPASAAVASDISIGYNTSTMQFHGKVSSSDAECVADRTVKVFKMTSSGATLEGKTTTATSGHWKVDVMNAHGRFFAVTPNQKIMTTHCARARSRTIDVM